MPELMTESMRQTPGYCAAYVGNIAFEASEDDLRAVFEGLAVTRVRMHTDAESGRFKGYAHVHFGDEASLDACAPALWLGRAGLLQGWPRTGRTWTGHCTEQAAPGAFKPRRKGPVLADTRL